MTNYCNVCYAVVESTTNHQNWHQRIDRQIRDLETKAENALREAKRAKRS